jgi:hypothetical protein
MAKGLLDELLDRVQRKPAPVRRRIAEEVHRATKHMAWVPNPGPQTQAYLSAADVLLYGGQAGGGKSHLMLGWGINEAEAGIIFRRELTQTDGLEADGKAILGARGWNGQDHEWTLPDTRSLKLAGMREADSWMGHAGRERDFYGYDEAGEFLEVQVASLFAWLRAKPGRRTRVVLASNPPRTSDGYWMLDWFGPWLDEEHPLYPVPPGELRWAVYIAKDLKNQPGQLHWVDGPGEYRIAGETYQARSYTFIPASLEDNPYRNTPEYRAQLQNLPEPLRSQLLKGDFKAGLIDDAYQVIPSMWVRAAQQRWLEAKGKPPEGVPMCAIAIDPSGGGEDDAVISQRYDAFFAELLKTSGKDIPKNRLGTFQGGLVVTNRRDNADVIVDTGGGYGGPIVNHLSENNDIECVAYKGAAASTRRTADRKYGFTNVRSAAYWKMREDLDPDQPGGSRVMLPPDKRLMAGLCAPTYEVRGQEIKIEPKSKNEGGAKGVVERLGWSPNESDAVVMANWAGPRWATNALQWIEQGVERARGRVLRGMQPKVVLGREAARRRR